MHNPKVEYEIEKMKKKKLLAVYTNKDINGLLVASHIEYVNKDSNVVCVSDWRNSFKSHDIKCYAPKKTDQL